MQQFIQTVKTRLAEKNDAVIGGIIVVVVLAVIATIFAVVQGNIPKVVYYPVQACDMLTLADAKEFLGEKAINASKTNPMQSGNTATSRCGYTDGQANAETMVVAAIMVRSGINDEGVEQNKLAFASNKSSEVEVLKNIGDDAFYNAKLGQLNILDDRNWIILSYGLGSSPELNTLDKATEIAQKVLSTQRVTDTQF